MEEFLIKKNACDEGCLFARAKGTLQATWDALCAGEERHAWLLWLAECALPKRQLVAFNIKNFRQLTPAGAPSLYEQLPSTDMHQVFEAAERYALGDETEDVLNCRLTRVGRRFREMNWFASGFDAVRALWLIDDFVASPPQSNMRGVLDAQRQQREWLAEMNPFDGNKLKQPPAT